VAEIRFNFFQEDAPKIKEILKKHWMKFYFVRHGESEFNHFTKTNPWQTLMGFNFFQHYNNEDSIYANARLHDPDDPKAGMAGENLSSQIDWERTLVFSSPLTRAKETAKLLLQNRGDKKIIVHPRLIELTGFADGILTKEQKDEGDELNASFDEETFPVPALPFKWNQFGDDYTQAEYFEPVFHDMIHEALNHEVDQIIIVGHSEWFKALAKLIAEKKLDWLESSWKKFAQETVDNAGIVEFEYDYTSNLVDHGRQRLWNRFYCHPKLFKREDSGESLPNGEEEIKKSRI